MDATASKGARRNAAKKAGKLAIWRDNIAVIANHRANLDGRRAQANGAREAAAKAISSGVFGLPHLLAAAAMLRFYSLEKSTRAISRIKRDLQVQVQVRGSGA